MNSSFHYKPKRVVNLENAKLHAKSLEVNESCTPKDCVKLLELRRLVREDPAFQNLSKEAEKLLMDNVVKLQDLKKIRAHPSNKAFALDDRTEVHDLNDHVSTSIASSFLNFDVFQLDLLTCSTH
jgi:hypothetical protein